MIPQVVGAVTTIATEPVVGATWSALILFVGGAIGAWGRAVLSQTQDVRTQRTAVDMLIGGAVGMLLPAFATKLVPIIGLDIHSLTAIQQGAIALLLGVTGSYVWTTIGWRMGLIVTPQQAATGAPPQKPQVGVLRGSQDAKAAAEKYDSEPHPPQQGRSGGQ